MNFIQEQLKSRLEVIVTSNSHNKNLATKKTKRRALIAPAIATLPLKFFEKRDEKSDLLILLLLNKVGKLGEQCAVIRFLI